MLGLLDAQPEFTTPIWDYLAALVDRQRVDDGRVLLQQHGPCLIGCRPSTASIRPPSSRSGAWRATTAVFGKRPLLQSLATLSCAGAASPSSVVSCWPCSLIDRGDLQAHRLTGSWAGAFGHTQFMPSTYARIAVDGDGDGRRDLVGSIRCAGLHRQYSSLRRLAQREPWGMEVRIPPGFDASQAGAPSVGRWPTGVRKV